MSRKFAFVWFGLMGLLALASADRLSNGRPLTFDRRGMVPLERMGALDDSHRALLEQVAKLELAEVTRKARARLLERPDDFQTAWILIQAVRLRQTQEATIRDFEALLAQRPDRTAVRYVLLRLHDEIRMEGTFFMTGNRTSEAYTKANLRYAELMKEWKASIPSRDWREGKVPLPMLVAIGEDPLYSHGEASDLLAAYMRAHGDDPILRLYQADQLMSGGPYAQMDEAEAVLTKLRKDKPNLSETLYFLGDLRVRQRRAEDAKKFFRMYIDSRPTNVALLLMAKEYVATGGAMAIRKKLPI
jgi:tetratricopeptide (TPR) repeat protein